MAFPPDQLSADEEVVLDLRPHWWYLAWPGGALLAAVLLGVVALAGDWPDVAKSIIGIGVLVAFGWFGIQYARWATTNFVVTNERVISRVGLVSKSGIEIPLDRINTVFFSQRVFERLIGSGDISIESASEQGRQTFSNVMKPNFVQQEIYRQKEALEKRGHMRMAEAMGAAAGTAAPPAPDIPGQIEKLDQLRRQGVLSDAEFEEKKRQLLDRM